MVGSASGSVGLTKAPASTPAEVIAPRAEQLELQAVEQHAPADALPVIAVRAIGDRDDRHFRMVDQILADARQIGDAIDAVRAQMIGRADARQHQQLRRDQRAGGDDHFAVGEGLLLGAVGVAPGDADRAAVLDLDALRLGAEADRSGWDCLPAAR